MVIREAATIRINDHQYRRRLQRIGADLKMKGAMVDAQGDAFVECDKAYGSLTDANMTATIPRTRVQHSRLAALMSNTMHDAEQYCILSVYMRLKGIIPPSSEYSARRYARNPTAHTLDESPLVS